MRAANTPDLAGTLLDQASRLRVLQSAAVGDLARARVAVEGVRRQASQAVGRRHAAEAVLAKTKADTALLARRKQLRGE